MLKNHLFRKLTFGELLLICYYYLFFFLGIKDIIMKGIDEDNESNNNYMFEYNSWRKWILNIFILILVFYLFFSIIFSNNLYYFITIGLYVLSNGEKISEFEYAKENPNGKFACQLYNKICSILCLWFWMDVKLYMFVYGCIYWTYNLIYILFFYLSANIIIFDGNNYISSYALREIGLEAESMLLNQP